MRAEDFSRAKAAVANGETLDVLGYRVDYDFLNASGVRIQQVAHCTYPTIGQSEDLARADEVLVNGASHVRWMLLRAKGQ